ncbi:interleukin-1 receptor accessory protein-like 1-A isoform X1 [Tachysurus ichikawai]
MTALIPALLLFACVSMTLTLKVVSKRGSGKALFLSSSMPVLITSFLPTIMEQCFIYHDQSSGIKAALLAIINALNVNSLVF